MGRHCSSAHIRHRLHSKSPGGTMVGRTQRSAAERRVRTPARRARGGACVQERDTRPIRRGVAPFTHSSRGQAACASAAASMHRARPNLPATPRRGSARAALPCLHAEVSEFGEKSGSSFPFPPRNSGKPAATARTARGARRVALGAGGGGLESLRPTRPTRMYVL